MTRQAADLLLAALKSVVPELHLEWTRPNVPRNSKAMFQKAVKWGWIAKNPFADAKHPDLILGDF